MLHVKLQLKINGPIYLLLGKSHHTFTENILWKLVTLVSCAFPWDQMWILWIIFTIPGKGLIICE